MKKLSSENHIILDFDYSDQTKEIMCSQSNNVLVVYSFVKYNIILDRLIHKEENNKN